jgi:hypothetical protein
VRGSDASSVRYKSNSKQVYKVNFFHSFFLVSSCASSVPALLAEGERSSPEQARTHAVGTHARRRCVRACLSARAFASSACHVLLYRRTAVYLSAHGAHVPRSSCCRGRCWCSRTGLAPTTRTSRRPLRSHVREIPNLCTSRSACILFLRLSEWKLERGELDPLRWMNDVVC